MTCFVRFIQRPRKGDNASQAITHSDVPVSKVSVRRSLELRRGSLMGQVQGSQCLAGTGPVGDFTSQTQINADDINDELYCG